MKNRYQLTVRDQPMEQLVFHEPPHHVLNLTLCYIDYLNISINDLQFNGFFFSFSTFLFFLFSATLYLYIFLRVSNLLYSTLDDAHLSFEVLFSNILRTQLFAGA